MLPNTDLDADTILRRYLLGMLATESLEGVERRLFSDDRIFCEHLTLAEDQLVDDYVWDRLDATDKESFERRFLTTRERLAKLEFARSLRDYIESRPQTRSWQWLRAPISMPAWAAAAAAVLLLVVVPGTVWQLGSSRPAGGIVVAASLAAGQLRGIDNSLPRIDVGPDCQLIRLPLETAHEGYASYTATLFLVADVETEVQSVSRLPASRGHGKLTVTLTLPCASLAEGDYFVRLKGVPTAGTPVDLEKFAFRVLRP
jgi:hypothetical protein